jgi:hypothetical protein
MSTFQPHGLIKTPLQEALYQRASIPTPSTNSKDYESLALLKVLLYTQLFTAADNFVVNSQQQSADIVVSHFGDGGFKPRVL